MRTRVLCAMYGVLLGFTARPVFGQFDSGSDGSDGAFNPMVDVEIDLSAAPTASWDTPADGRGVYDPERWAVVFKYTTIDIPEGITVTFRNHPSHAPVVWLASGNVTIAGTVNLNGEDGHPVSDPRYSEPGPGGFAGTIDHDIGAVGFGPGGGPIAGSRPDFAVCSEMNFGLGGAYATRGQHYCCGCFGCYLECTTSAQEIGSTTGVVQPSVELYGGQKIIPLMGGSGGGVSPDDPLITPEDPVEDPGGGAGGGAILIASTDTITVGGTGLITCDGGGGDTIQCGGLSGAGSGGAIRLLAEAIQGSGLLRAKGGGGCNPGGDGRIRVEANTVLLTNSDPDYTLSTPPGPLWAPNNAPTLKATFVDATSMPPDPAGGILTQDLSIDNADAATFLIEATNIPVGTTVTVVCAPLRGPAREAFSTPLADAGGGLLAATAELVVPPGPSECYLRANWNP